MNFKLPLALTGAAFLAACTPAQTPSTTDYVPAFTRVPAGYRPTLASYYPVVTYVGCQALTPGQIREIQQDFYRPIANSAYRPLIGAIVINGAGDLSGTTFTLWLLDGRKLAASEISAAARSDQKIGRRFYDQAIALLQSAISPATLRAAGISRNTVLPYSGSGTGCSMARASSLSTFTARS